MGTLTYHVSIEFLCKVNINQLGITGHIIHAIGFRSLYIILDQRSKGTEFILLHPLLLLIIFNGLFNGASTHFRAHSANRYTQHMPKASRLNCI